jgi:hypothetical protein
MGKHMEYFKETFKHRRSAIKSMKLTTITNIIEEYPRFQDVPDMVSFYLKYSYLLVTLLRVSTTEPGSNLSAPLSVA